MVRYDDDFRPHVDYVRYNTVKHGLVMGDASLTHPTISLRIARSPRFYLCMWT
jgi:hypothetical protein